MTLTLDKSLSWFPEFVDGEVIAFKTFGFNENGFYSPYYSWKTREHKFPFVSDRPSPEWTDAEVRMLEIDKGIHVHLNRHDAEEYREHLEEQFFLNICRQRKGMGIIEVRCFIEDFVAHGYDVHGFRSAVFTKIHL